MLKFSNSNAFEASKLKKLATATLTFIVFTTIAVTAWKLNEQYQLTAPLTTVAFLVGTLLAVVYRVINPFGWAFVLRGMNQKVDSYAATRIWLLGESRRWLPGGVWGYASRAVAAKEIGVSKTVASASMAVELLLTIAAAGIISVLGVALYFSKLSTSVHELMESSGIGQNAIVYGAVALVVLAAVAFMMRKGIGKKFTKATQKFEALRGVKVEPKWLIGSLSYLVVMAGLNGLVNTVLLQAIDSTSVPIVAMIASTATAWIIGFFAIFSPGGIIVREAALATLLLPWLPWEVGFSLAILSRFAQLIAEVVGMGLTLWKPSKSVARV